MTKKTPKDTLNTDLDVDMIDMMETDTRLPEIEEVYAPVNQLHVPDEAKRKFQAEGFSLQWIRIYSGISGEFDVSNIQKKEAAGFTFVKRSEIPGLTSGMSGLFKKEAKDPTSELYIIGDLALAKIPTEKVIAKRKYIEQQTRARNRAIIDDLRKNSVMPDASRGEEFKTTRSRGPNSRDVGFGE